MTPVLKYSVVSVALVGATAVLFAVAYGAPEARLGIGIAGCSTTATSAADRKSVV